MVDEAPEGPERRFGKRLKLPVTVRVRVADGPVLATKVHDVNARGLSLEAVAGARVGDQLAIEFDGYPGVCAAFSIIGQVVRIVDPVANGVGVQVSRTATTPESVQS